MKKPLNSMTVTFDSRSVNEGFARVCAASFVAQLDPTMDELNDLKTAVSEAVTNAIVHGYSDCVGKITLTVKIFENSLVEILVRHKGRGIPDIEKARQPLYTTGGKERSGMGFTIMESFMDHISVKSAPGKGTIVTLRKKLAPRSRPPT